MLQSFSVPHAITLWEGGVGPGFHQFLTSYSEASGSPIVDGPEVPEDRDPAQREAERPRSSMDYSEFPLIARLLSTKKRSIVS